MKRLLLSLLLLFSISAAPVASYAYPDTGPAVVLAEVAPAPVEATTPTDTPEPEKSAEAASDAEQSSSEGESGTGWVNVAGTALKLLLPLIGLLIVGLGVPWVLKLLKKAGMENAQILEDVLTTLVKKAINYAESLATSLEQKPAPANKKAAAVNFVLDKVKDYGLPQLGEEYVGKLIEAQLARDKAKAA